MFIANAEGLQMSDTYYLQVLLRGEVVAEHRARIIDLQESPPYSGIRID